VDSDSWPLESMSAELVARVVRDIDRRTEDETVVMLSELLCASWGSLEAQNQ
jgi:hypothetical protein